MRWPIRAKRYHREMARLAVFRSMQNVRAGEKHRAYRTIPVDATATRYFAVCELAIGTAWATDRLTEVRRRMEAELGLLRSYATEAECKATGRNAVDEGLRANIADRLGRDARYVAVQRFVEMARDAEGEAMTLVYDDEEGE